MKAKCIMVQGTASSVGKSLIAAGLCRIFRQDGYRVAPFKSQNMALNSYITSEGGEMGRAQVVQAEAAGVEPSVLMNPILIKPVTDTAAQVIINGSVHGNLTAAEYHNLKPELKGMISDTWSRLSEEYEVIVIEGAGSPAEINLRENDLVNMGMAEIADAPVILVGDIDKGGVFASIAGTLLLLSEAERARVKGVVINKFRGDPEILKPGIGMLEDIIKIPVLGVIPYERFNIDEEDGFLADKFSDADKDPDAEIDIAIVKYPYMSNDSDFNALENVRGVGIRYVNRLQDLGKPDMIILPGSKSTISDLLFLRDSGLENAIRKLAEEGVPVFGICGGFQMLGKMISDPEHVESGQMEIEGMSLLDIETVFEKRKTTTQTEAVVADCGGILAGLRGTVVRGYEIHMGTSAYSHRCRPLLEIGMSGGREVFRTDGASNMDGNILGTYLHGIFDNTPFTMGLINNLRRHKGLPGLDFRLQRHSDFKDAEYDRLAGLLRENLDIKSLYEIMDGKV